MYKLKTVYANLPADQAYVGDIYDTLEIASAEHPDQKILAGYCVVDENGRIAPETQDWYDTLESAKEDMEILRNKERNDAPIVWATKVSTDLNGNVSFDLPPTAGRLVSDEGTEYFVPQGESDPTVRYQAHSNVFVLDTKAHAEDLYLKLLDAVEEKATHAIRQVSYLRAKYEQRREIHADD